LTGADLCVCTISLARDEPESELIRRALQRLSAMGVRVVVADGGSPPAVLEFIRNLRGVSLVPIEGRGLVAQIKAALAGATALGTRFVLYTEADKALFFEQHLADFIERAPADDDLGVVVAARTPESFATFPPFQRFTEAALAHLTAEITKHPADYSYGPFLMNSTLTGRINEVGDALGWGWRHFMFGITARSGYRVTHVAGPYECPLDQRAEGERDRVHRLRQLSQSVEGLVLAMTSDGDVQRKQHKADATK
jgi:hypothetical protein